MDSIFSNRSSTLIAYLVLQCQFFLPTSSLLGYRHHFDSTRVSQWPIRGSAENLLFSSVQWRSTMFRATIEASWTDLGRTGDSLFRCPCLPCALPGPCLPRAGFQRRILAAASRLRSVARTGPRHVTFFFSPTTYNDGGSMSNYGKSETDHGRQSCNNAGRTPPQTHSVRRMVAAAANFRELAASTLREASCRFFCSDQPAWAKRQWRNSGKTWPEQPTLPIVNLDSEVPHKFPIPVLRFQRDHCREMTKCMASR